MYTYTQRKGKKGGGLSREELWQRKFQNRFEGIDPSREPGSLRLDQRYPRHRPHYCGIFYLLICSRPVTHLESWKLPLCPYDAVGPGSG